MTNPAVTHRAPFKSGGTRRLIFTNTTPLNENRYIVGANVGALNRSVRRALMNRASNNAGGKPCCMTGSNANY